MMGVEFKELLDATRDALNMCDGRMQTRGIQQPCFVRGKVATGAYFVRAIACFNVCFVTPFLRAQNVCIIRD